MKFFLLKRNHDEDFLVVWKRIAQSMMFFKTDMYNCISRNKKRNTTFEILVKYFSHYSLSGDDRSNTGHPVQALPFLKRLNLIILFELKKFCL